jgi:predicted AlkP superfamily phosphohydrolase/phosphomutase
MEHTANVKKEFKALIDHLRKDVERLEDPKAKALFEVSAEVIAGLEKAFTDYEQKNEAAWRK